jgi:acyl-CoA synthetase (AMP-forming)/AMP-acid ligase II
VLLSHANLADVVERLNAVMGVTAEIREYVGVPVYHSFGFGRCRAVSVAGGRAYLPARGFNPVEINGLLEKDEINAISAVPSLWRVLLQTGAVSARAAEKVRWIEIGSQSMAAGEKRALVTLFPQAKIVQHYGLTEASRTTFLEVDTASDSKLDSVGRAVGQVELRISEDGRIQIRGPHVATGHVDRGRARVDPRDGDGWLTTNDRGQLQDGYLHFAGRSDDMINCGGLKLAPDALEASIAAQLGGLGSFAVLPHRRPGAWRRDSDCGRRPRHRPKTSSFWRPPARPRSRSA